MSEKILPTNNAPLSTMFLSSTVFYELASALSFPCLSRPWNFRPKGSFARDFTFVDLTHKGEEGHLPETLLFSTLAFKGKERFTYYSRPWRIKARERFTYYS